MPRKNNKPAIPKLPVPRILESEAVADVASRMSLHALMFEWELAGIIMYRDSGEDIRIYAHFSERIYTAIKENPQLKEMLRAALQSLSAQLESGGEII